MANLQPPRPSLDRCFFTNSYNRVTQMNRFLFPLTALLCCVINQSLQGQNLKVEKMGDKLATQAITLNPEYLVFYPATKTTEPVPLVIYLHGAGGVGDEILKIKGQADQIVRGISQNKKNPCLVVAPQVSRKNRQPGGWIPSHLNLFLKHLKNSLNLDDNRIYLTGNSMGGYGSWTWGGLHPEHFAAIAPVSGGIGPGGPKDVTTDLNKWAANLSKIPVFAFAGVKDRVVPAERSQRMINAIQKAGGKQARIKLYPEEGHGAGRKAFADVEFYKWMFSQKRK